MADPYPNGMSLLAELQWVHAHLRADLATCQALAAAAADGAPAAVLRDGVRQLQTGGPLFQLRVNCLQYCALVHGHHGLEDAQLFPVVLRHAPALAAAVDRLEADHRVISDLLDQVEGSVRTLADHDPGGRKRLVDALAALSTDLLEHLRFEEESIGPLLDTWTRSDFG